MTADHLVSDTSPGTPDSTATGALAEVERRVAWLRLIAVPLIAFAETLPHPNPEETAFFAGLGVVSAYAVAAFAWVHLRPVTRGYALAATAADVAAITALAVLSGGAFSEARLAYFLVPVAVAFRFRMALTAAASGITVLAYLAQALAHPARSNPHALRFVLVQAGYLLWLGLAAVLLAALLERRTRRVTQLAEARRRLMVDALTASERERRSLAEGLHDSAVQNLLSVRHELEEAGVDAHSHTALQRAETALRQTIGELRDAIFELHPYILEQAGLESALRAVAERAARRGGFKLQFQLDHRHRYPSERLLLAAARELLSNAAAHSGASSVTVRLGERDGHILLAVTDDGRGFDPAILPGRLAEGHIGILSQRERIETIGGRLEIHSAPGQGTTAEIHIPQHAPTNRRTVA